MKGFISYAHDDIEMFEQFRIHLSAIERAFDISFWADESIQAGHQWNATIQHAINEADLFILLMSPAFLCSDYIIGQEIPEIGARARFH